MPIAALISNLTRISVEPGSLLVHITMSAGAKISLPTPIFGFESSLSGSYNVFSVSNHIVRYFCVLTGAADGTTDITLPMSSFQARRRSGAPTYLSVVIPTMDYAEQIAARPSGTLKIQQAYEQSCVINQIETIIEASLDEVNIDDGGANKSTTLVCSSTYNYSPKEVTISGLTYRSTRSGKYHYRLARPYIFLNPGDTVTFTDDGISFEIDTMSYFINATTSTIELASV
jgi:hypothetical protein